MRRLALIPLLCAAAFAEPDFPDLDAPPHEYHRREPHDPFTKLKDALESGRLAVDRSSEKAFVASLLRALSIPASSQMLVFSTTSLQLRLITLGNPRALYFNEDTYLGWVPGGRIEVLSLDPELGAIFYIFDPPRADAPIRVERSERCMNCHAGDDTGRVPGLVIRSVLSGERGGSLKSFRVEQTGHQIPFAERFGGWYVTGDTRIASALGNFFGYYVDGTLTKAAVEPGRRFDFADYLVPSSDVLPQLIHEHQAGFINRVIEAGYRARTWLHADGGQLTAAHTTQLDEHARQVVRYLLFADEAPLPADGLRGAEDFQADFLQNRRPGPGGASLKDFDLHTHLFRHRCSYMIYSPIFTTLPAPLKQRIYTQLDDALSVEKPHPDFAYLPAAEKAAIRGILKATVSDLAAW